MNTTHSPIKEPWIQIGYELFAFEGPQALKVEVISKKVGKNKSSFYHLFGEMELFINALLAYHLERVLMIAKEERAAKSIDPELIHVLLKFKVDMLFSKQLRINRAIPKYKACFEKANQLIGDAFIGVWANDLDLKDRTIIATNLYEFALENFYLQITEENLNYDWLSQYFRQLHAMVSSLKNS